METLCFHWAVLGNVGVDDELWDVRGHSLIHAIYSNSGVKSK